jgi:hypothetical protein
LENLLDRIDPALPRALTAAHDQAGLNSLLAEVRAQSHVIPASVVGG